MARRRHRRNPARKYKVKHVVIKKNPRHRRRNPAGDPASKAADEALGAIAAMEGPRSEAPASRPGRGFKSQWAKGVRMAEGKQRKRVEKSLRSAAKAQRKRAKKSKIAVVKRSHAAQAARLEAVAALVKSRGRTKALTSPLVKAMTVKSNPGFAGAVEAAKVMLPQVAAGGVGLVGLAMAGKYVAEMIVQEDKAGVKSVRESFKKDGKITALGTYMPAISTAALSAVGYMVADKVAPKYKGAILIGGMLGAAIQAVLAAAAGPDVKADSLLAKAKSAITLGEYTTVGGGIFRGIGEYTTVGNAHPFRPRNYGDNATEFAPLGEISVQPPGGGDNATEFAPGEGGIFAKASIMDRMSKIA